MRLIEIRELEGPNPYLAGPAIKIEMDLEAHHPNGRWATRLGELVPSVDPERSAGGVITEGRDAVGRCLTRAIEDGARAAELPAPACVSVDGDIATRIVVAFAWERRPVALALAAFAVEVMTQACGEAELVPERVAERTRALRRAIQSPEEADDRPEVIEVGDGPPGVVAITGTNGKTTTTRLVAHLLGRSGCSVGWSSTSGVYINREEIETGDWSGPAGARRLIGRDDLDWAILETARGGILRRGLAYDRAHVSAMINVSADHLGDYGVWSTRTLAGVKGTVLRATRPDGWAIINADDPLVFEQRHEVSARRCYVTRHTLTNELARYLDSGGRVVSVEDGSVIVRTGNDATPIVPLADVPLTFGGVARHMVENVLCAVGIALGCGLTVAEISRGLTSFAIDPSSNPGRLNVYSVRGATYLADYAHNEAGLAELIHLARTMIRDDGRLWLVIGTAGDRTDDTFRALGRMAAEASSHIIPRDTPHYLRGRKPGETQALMEAGVVSAGGQSLALMSDEIGAIDLTLADVRPGDVVAVMASDQPAAVAEHLARLATAG